LVSERGCFRGRMTRRILWPNQRTDLGELLLLPMEKQISAQ